MAVTQPVVSLLLLVVIRTFLNLDSCQVERRVRLQVLISAACWMSLNSCHLLLSLLLNVLLMLKLMLLKLAIISKLKLYSSR